MGGATATSGPTATSGQTNQPSHRDRHIGTVTSGPSHRDGPPHRDRQIINRHIGTAISGQTNNDSAPGTRASGPNKWSIRQFVCPDEGAGPDKGAGRFSAAHRRVGGESPYRARQIMILPPGPGPRDPISGRSGNLSVPMKGLGNLSVPMKGLVPMKGPAGSPQPIGAWVANGWRGGAPSSAQRPLGPPRRIDLCLRALGVDDPPLNLTRMTAGVRRVAP
jgi:hypothetical protein